MADFTVGIGCLEIKTAGGRTMKKCEQEVAGHCCLAITYKKYATSRKCEKCCLYCLETCKDICKINLQINEEGAYE